MCFTEKEKSSPRSDNCLGVGHGLVSTPSEKNRKRNRNWEGKPETKVKEQIRGLDAADVVWVTAHSWTTLSDISAQGAMANTQL